MNDVRHGVAYTEGEAARSPEDALHQVIEPGERIIWSGRPDPSAMVQGVGTRRMHSVGSLMVVATTAVGIWLIARRRGIESGPLVDQLTQDGGWVFVLGAVGIVSLSLILRIAGKSSAARRYRAWARSLTYGITDRRLLIVEGDAIAWACAPDDLGPIRLRVRTPTRGDLVFREGSGGGGKETVYSRDRRRIGFKALAEPEKIQEVLERWRDAHRTGAERQVAAFLDQGISWPAEADEGSLPSALRVENPRYGLEVTFPESWTVEVRKRRVPYGKFAFELERWQPLDDSTDWNVVRARGPYHTSVEIHLDVVPEPVTTLEEMKDSWIYQSLAGELLDTDDSVRWGRFKGFSATRRHVEHAPDQAATDVERPAFIRSTFLHDGRLQVGITVTWPEGSDRLEAALDKVVQEMTLTQLDAYEPLPTTPSEAARYFGWLVIAGRIVRVFFGLVFFSAGVWTGYVEAVRVAESGGSGSWTWMIPAIGGLVAMLRPLALPFHSLRGFTHAPLGRRVLMTLGSAVAIVLLIGALFP